MLSVLSALWAFLVYLTVCAGMLVLLGILGLILAQAVLVGAHHLHRIIWRQ